MRINTFILHKDYTRFPQNYQLVLPLDQNKRTNSKADLFAHLFGQFVNCIQHIIIV